MSTTMKTFKTCKQSYEMYFPNSTNKFVGYEEAPPLPLEPGTEFCKISKRILNAWIYWTPDTTEVKYDDGRILIYWRKPTLQSAIGPSKSGEYFRFHADGSVEHGIHGEYYRWGPDFDVEYDTSGLVEECTHCAINQFREQFGRVQDHDEDDDYDRNDYFDYRDEVGSWYY